MPSTNLQRTMGTATNAKKGTLSFWTKLAKSNNSSEYMRFFNIGGTDFSFYYIDDNLNWYVDGGATFSSNLDRELRDYSGYYHIVLNFDTTLATAGDRSKLYINGELQSQTIAGTITQNADIFDSSHVYSIGATNSSNLSQAFAGILAHFHFIDGTAYDASAFGLTDSASGIWKPKVFPSVTYGTNGFFLNFANSSDLGNDVSGNNNDFTMSGTGTQTLDTPSNVFATLNALNSTLTNSTLTNGNLQFAGGRQDANYAFTSGTIAPSQGKWYWEVKAVDNAEIDQVGVAKMDLAQFANISNSGGLQATTYGGKGVQFSNGVKVGDGSGSTYMGGFSANDVLMVALDLDNGNIYFGRNGQWSDGAGNADQTFANAVAAFTNLTVGDAYVPAHCMRNFGGSNPGESEYNFGNGIFGTTAVSTPESDSAGLGKFEYSVPTGYYALCTKNIADYG